MYEREEVEERNRACRRTSGACWFNIYKFSEVLGLLGLEKVISKRDYFVVGTLFYFEPVQKFEYRDDMFSFGAPVAARARAFAVTGDEISFLFCGKGVLQ